MEALIRAGKIRRWGVSNSTTAIWSSWSALAETPAPLIRSSIMSPSEAPTMAYSPVGQGRLPASPALAAVATRHGATPYQVALAWMLRDFLVIAIPNASDVAHVAQNRQTLTWC